MEKADNKAIRRWIFALSKGHRAKLGLLTAGRVSQGAAYVLLSLMTKEVIDHAVSGDASGAVRYGAMLLGLAIFCVLLRTGLAILLRTVEKQMQIALRAKAYRSLSQKKQAAISCYHSGVLLDRINTDTPHVIECLVSIVPDLAGMTTNLLGAMGALAIMSGWLTAALLAFGFVTAFFARFARRRMRKFYRDMSEKSETTNAFYLEWLSHSLLIKVYGADERAKARAKKLESKGYASWHKYLIFNQTVKTGASAFFELGYYGALLVGAYALFKQALSYGTLMAVLQLVSQIQDPFAEIGAIASLYNTSLAAAERMMELENLPDEPQAPIPDRDTLYEKMDRLVIRNVSFGYSDEKVLKSVDAQINKGDFAVIAGPSGAGKSTLQKLILGVMDDYEGQIALECGGQEIPLGVNTRSLFAYVPQGDMVISGTMLENLTFLCGEHAKAEIDNALKLSCLDEFVRQLPNGLDTPIGEHGVGLSEGQNQRLAIARALLSGAPILLMDEPTSALDAQTEKRVLEQLRALPGRTIILVSHKEAAYSLCDVELRIDHGSITQRRFQAS